MVAGADATSNGEHASALSLNVLVHRVSELLGFSTITSASLAADHVIDENPQSILRREPNAGGSRVYSDPLLIAFMDTSNDEVECILKALALRRLVVGVDGLVGSVVDVQKRVREMVRLIPGIQVSDQEDTIRHITSMSDDRLVVVSRALGIFASVWDLAALREMVSAEVDLRRSLAMRLKRLGLSATSTHDETSRAVRSAVAVGASSFPSEAAGLNSIAMTINVSGGQAVRRGLYELVMRVVSSGGKVPPGLPRRVDAEVRRCVVTEHVKRCSQWYAQTNVCAQKCRLFITDRVAMDVFASVARKGTDDTGSYVVERKVRDSRMLGVQRAEEVQAQFMIAMYNVDRVLIIEECGSSKSQSWVERCDPDRLASLLEDLRAVVREKVLQPCVVTFGANVTDSHGHVCGKAHAQILDRKDPPTDRVQGFEPCNNPTQVICT